MNSSIKKSITVIVLIALLIAFAWYMGVHKYLSLTSFKANKLMLENAVAMNYQKSVLIYIAIYICILALALPGVPALTVAGGFLFGFMPGVVYASIGAVSGSTISFLMIRYLLAALIRGKYAEKLERFNQKIQTYGMANYLLTLQLIGIIPYFVINILAALTHVPLTILLWTTAIGSLPILCIYSFAGKQLYLLNSLDDIFSPSMIAVLFFLGLLALMPLVLRFFNRVTDL